MPGGDHFIHRDRTFGSLLISSPQGHSGKTIVAVGLCNLLRERGLSIQPFKKGPDYIDPSWLTIAAERSCRNLDLFLIPKNKLIQNFERTCGKADLCIVEGAMGLYDGLNARGTTAEISRLLDIPIVLVVNTSRMTGSIAAMVMGYQHFQPEINIAGIILNYVSGSRHENKLRQAVEKYCKIPVVGSISRDESLHIAERHLGLIPTLESLKAKALVKRISQTLESRFDFDRILAIAGNFQSHRIPFDFPKERKVVRPQKVRIGILRDRVFNFYYPENFEALEGAGAELIFINSLEDRLPRIDGLYIGGGFPEFFLKGLEKNEGLQKDIGNGIEAGLPVYAECAGLMYLCEKIHWRGRSYKMVGVIPAEVQISEKPEGHGYVVAEVIHRNPFFPIGLNIRGHEFHHSNVSIKKKVKFAYRLRRGYGIDGQRDGILYKNMFASYTHLHALGTPSWAKTFVLLAAKGREERGRET